MILWARSLINPAGKKGYGLWTSRGKVSVLREAGSCGFREAFLPAGEDLPDFIGREDHVPPGGGVNRISRLVSELREEREGDAEGHRDRDHEEGEPRG